MSKAAELANLIGNINAGGGGANKNVIINGAMNVAQRGTSSTGIGGSDGYFTCDRWKFAQATNAGRLTMTQDSSAPSGFANSMKLACTTADTSIGAGEVALIQQSIEGQNLQGFAKGTSDAKPFALSFYVKGNASATYTVELNDTDNTRFNSQEFSVTTDWTRVTKTFVADTTGAFNDDNSTSLKLMIWLHAGSTYTGGTHTDNVWHTTTNQRVGDSQTSFYDSTDRTLFITGVQLEVGQNATSFEHTNNFGVELAKCQRYYQEIELASTFREVGTQEYADFFPFNTAMRAAPTGAVVTQFQYWNGGTPTNVTPTFTTKISGSTITAPNLTTSGNGLYGGKASFDSEL